MLDLYRLILMSRPFCLAIINDEEGLPKTLGKKKLKECRLPLKRMDEYTSICPLGHRKRNTLWEYRSFALFYGVKIKGSSKV